MEDIILIGSRALKISAPQCLSREPRDFDFISPRKDADLWLDKNKPDLGNIISSTQGASKYSFEGTDAIVEFEIFDTETDTMHSSMFYDLVKSDRETINTSFGMIPNLDLLFTLKSSHRYMKDSPHFWKTLQDYHRMKDAGAKVRPEYRDFLKLREAATYTYKHPKLNVDKKDFFKDDGIQYVYDHDQVHWSVKTLDAPAYTYYMREGSEVFSDKGKFFACSRQIQLLGVVEEALTLAIERSLVPHPGKWIPDQAFTFALSKVCTSICSGWFREFAYENILDVIKMYTSSHKNYFLKFQDDVDNGRVRSYSGSMTAR